MLSTITENQNHHRAGLRLAFAAAEPRRAAIRRTDYGARIDFSDGRVVSLNKEPHIAESTFLAAVLHWAQRHGAHSTTVEFE
jgi:hypothetical protein